MKHDEVKAELDKLVTDIVTEATGKKIRVATDASHKDVPFSEKLDAFKALTNYYGLLMKHKPKGEDDSDGPDFSDFSESMNADQEHTNGGTPQVRSRPGRA